MRLNIEDVKNATTEQLVEEFDYQILLMCMKSDDKLMVNTLGKELKERGEYALFEDYKKRIVQTFMR